MKSSRDSRPKRFRHCIKQTIILVLLYPWMIGCQRTFQPNDQNWLEAMGGFGKFTQTIYYVPPAPNCGPEAIGRYDVNFGDAGIRLGHYGGKHGLVLEGGAGYITTLKESQVRWYDDSTTAPNVGLKKTYYGFVDAGYDGDYFGYRLGIFISDSLQYEEQLIAPILRFRFGALDEIHGEFGVMRNPTSLSSGSIIDAGVFFPVKAIRSMCYLGIGSSSGYSSGLILSQIEVQASDNISVKATGNYGLLPNVKRPGDPFEFGVGFGIKYRW